MPRSIFIHGAIPSVHSLRQQAVNGWNGYMIESHPLPQFCPCFIQVRPLLVSQSVSEDMIPECHLGGLGMKGLSHHHFSYRKTDGFEVDLIPIQALSNTGAP